MEQERHHVWESLVLSLALHVLLLHAGHWSFHSAPAPPVEVDITSIGVEGIRETQAKPLTSPRPRQAPLLVPVTPAGPTTAPSSSAPAPPPQPTASAAGADPTSSVASLRLPQLLNPHDLAALLRRFYPEAARAELRQATVVLDLHIDVDGSVRWAEIVNSGGPDFDAAALKAARLLRFTPAFDGTRVVAVKMRQTIQFKLED